MIIKTMPPSKNLKKLDIFVRGHLVVLWLIYGRGVIWNGKQYKAMFFGVVYWLKNANKPRQYRLFISLEILKRDFLAWNWLAFFSLILNIAPIKRSGVLWYYAMNKVMYIYKNNIIIILLYDLDNTK